ncbi:MAG: hypothetical protein A3G34_16980 [Candidatus Lindowbacteria bacterium RIFCSPLOWO2_12_FULL_62_27]|nr:MAG: hypothetical protein A3G34_16980 [Candidatus Lindowbacteria bacterium RIFCSPLOWO2_12_FULL_62_27]OGH63954.1 MAG: hypothetical protein A3I06_10335 [Candidatus Lindowbacteria bacterium RIFCSPLOWO2_02_FULL_62_12]
MNKVKKLPDEFGGDEAAGKFWDTHSSADYEDEMTEVEMEVDIRRRTFLVPVSDRIYRIAKKRAAAKRCSVQAIINTLLRRDLVQAR